MLLTLERVVAFLSLVGLAERQTWNPPSFYLLLSHHRNARNNVSPLSVLAEGLAPASLRFAI